MRLALQWVTSILFSTTHANVLDYRYNIRAFDTSPYYGVSEIVLGTVLKVLEPIFPRSSYKLVCPVFLRYISPSSSHCMLLN